MRLGGVGLSDEPPGLTRSRSGELRLLVDDCGLSAALAGWLMARPEIGMVFSRDDVAPAIAGAPPLSAVALDHARAPDIVYVAPCEDEADRWGLPGRGLATGGPPAGGGMHGWLNRRELATVLMVSAPEGAGGVENPRPCGLVDIAPTALALLGLDGSGCDGAALPPDGEAAPPVAASEIVAERPGFRQRLLRRAIDGRRYLSEGGRA